MIGWLNGWMVSWSVGWLDRWLVVTLVWLFVVKAGWFDAVSQLSYWLLLSLVHIVSFKFGQSFSVLVYKSSPEIFANAGRARINS